MPGEVNGWAEYQKLVLAELERHNRLIEDLRNDVHEFRTDVTRDIATLKVKAGLWGLMGGIVPVGIALVIYMMQKLGG